MRKNPPTVQEIRVQSLGRADLQEKGMATHSSLLAWRIPWTEDPGRLQSMGLQRVGHDRVIFTYILTSTSKIKTTTTTTTTTFQKFYLNVSDTHFMIKSDSFPLGSSLGTSIQTFSCASRISDLLSSQMG